MGNEGCVDISDSIPIDTEEELEVSCELPKAK